MPRSVALSFFAKAYLASKLCLCFASIPQLIS